MSGSELEAAIRDLTPGELAFWRERAAVYASLSHAGAAGGWVGRLSTC